MASAAAGRSGAQNFGSVYFKPMLRKAYHRKSGSTEMMNDSVKLNGEDVGCARGMGSGTGTGTGTGGTGWWVRDGRTGIFYPKGQEKVMEDVPQGAAKDLGKINWFD